MAPGSTERIQIVDDEKKFTLVFQRYYVLERPIVDLVAVRILQLKSSGGDFGMQGLVIISSLCLGLNRRARVRDEFNIFRHYLY